MIWWQCCEWKAFKNKFTCQNLRLPLSLMAIYSSPPKSVSIYVFIRSLLAFTRWTLCCDCGDYREGDKLLRCKPEINDWIIVSSVFWRKKLLIVSLIILELQMYSQNNRKDRNLIYFIKTKDWRNKNFSSKVQRITYVSNSITAKLRKHFLFFLWWKIITYECTHLLPGTPDLISAESSGP